MLESKVRELIKLKYTSKGGNGPHQGGNSKAQTVIMLYKDGAFYEAVL